MHPKPKHPPVGTRRYVPGAVERLDALGWYPVKIYSNKSKRN